MPLKDLTARRRTQLTQDRVSRVHQPAFLKDVSLGFNNPALIAERVCPTIGVAKQSDLYRVFGRNTMRTHETRWAPGTVPNAIQMRWSSDQYFCDLRKLRINLTDAERNNSDSDLDLEAMYTEIVSNAIDIGREKRVADLFTTVANYAASNKLVIAGGSEYDQAAQLADAQLITDVQKAVSQVAQQAMVPKNMITIVIPQLVVDQAILNNTAMLDRIKYTQRATAVAVEDLLTQLWSVKEVIIAQSMYVGQGPEAADSDVITGYTPTYLWGDTMWIGVVNAGSDNHSPWFARTFRWNGETNGQDRQVRMYRDEDEGKEQDWIEVKEARSEKLAFPLGGYVISNCLSTI